MWDQEQTQPINFSSSVPEQKNHIVTEKEQSSLHVQVSNFKFSNDFLVNYLPSNYFGEVKKEKKFYYTFLTLFLTITIASGLYVLVVGLLEQFNLPFILSSVFFAIVLITSAILIWKFQYFRTTIKRYLEHRAHFDKNRIFPFFIYNIYKRLRLNLTHIAWISAYIYVISFISSLFFLIARFDFNWDFLFITVNWQSPGDWITTVLIGISAIFIITIVVQVTLNIIIRKRLSLFLQTYGALPAEEEIITQLKTTLNKNYRLFTIGIFFIITIPLLVFVKYIIRRKR